MGLLHTAVEDLGIDLPFFIVRLQFPEVVHRRCHTVPHQSVEPGLKPPKDYWIEKLESEIKDPEKPG